MNDCKGCLYKHLPNDGGHCYMFREEPKPLCAQWKSGEEETKKIAAFLDFGRRMSASALHDDGQAEDEGKGGT
jgi:hypothetical protein